MLTHGPRIRLRGHGARLRLRERGHWQSDPLAALRECCCASMALDKATGEAIRGAIAGGASWREVGRVLGVAEDADSKNDVIAATAQTRLHVWGRFWG